MKHEIEELFKQLGIIENTTNNKRNRGTRSFLLPNGLEVASYKTGYIRRTGFKTTYINGEIVRKQLNSCWQLNKRNKKYYNGSLGNYSIDCNLEFNEDKRLLMLANYYLKTIKV